MIKLKQIVVTNTALVQDYSTVKLAQKKTQQQRPLYSTQRRNRLQPWNIKKIFWMYPTRCAVEDRRAHSRGDEVVLIKTMMWSIPNIYFRISGTRTWTQPRWLEKEMVKPGQARYKEWGAINALYGHQGCATRRKQSLKLTEQRNLHISVALDAKNDAI